MEITKDSDVTPEAVIALRNKLGLSQTKFWEGIGFTQVMGSKYENGHAQLENNPHVRQKIILHYICNIDTNCQTPADVERLKRLGEKDVFAREAQQKIRSSIEHANKIIDKLTGI